LATETTDEEFARQWAADYQPTSSNKNENIPAPATPEPWRQVGNTDAQIEEFKKKLQFLENELAVSRETNKTAHEKHQESLSRSTRVQKESEEKYKVEIARLNHELNMVKSSGKGVNDTLINMNYSKAAPAEKPKAAALSDVIAHEQKQKEKGKEKEREDKSKEREDRERQDRLREENIRYDKDRDDKDKEEREKQNAAFKQKTVELEAKYKQVAEQVNLPHHFFPVNILTRKCS
jgi:hypothetical protein